MIHLRTLVLGPVVIILGLGAAFLAAGCGEATSIPKEDVYPVKGKVLLPDGKPLTEGYVEFVPNGGSGRHATGEVKSDGTFELKTDLGDGAPAGKYVVAVRPAATGLPKGKVVKPGDIKSPVPPLFQDDETSSITKEVTKGQNDLTIDLKEEAAQAKTQASTKKGKDRD